MLHIDFETRSTVDLKKQGAWQYAAHPSTRPLCMAYAFGSGPVEPWLPGEPCPPAIVKHVREGRRIAAWNAFGFERLIWQRVMVPRFGWPAVERDQWVDPMAQAKAMGLPAGLDDCARVLGLNVRKDRRGAVLIRKLCVPQGYTPEGEPIWNDDPALLAEMAGEYCPQDVVVERAIMPHLRPLSDDEASLLVFDSIMNDRGLGLDTALVTRLQQIVAAEKERINDALKEQTGWRVETASDLRALRALLATEDGWEPAKLDKWAIKESQALDLTEVSRAALTLRAEAAKASTAKLNAALARVDEHGRMRGLFNFHRAATGRWAGVAFQPHNLPRASLDDEETGLRADAAIEALMGGVDPADVAECYGVSVMEMVSRLLRGCIVPAEGRDLWSIDLAGIESRVLAWLAYDQTKLQVFREGRDPYKYAASGIYHVPEPEVTKPQRQIGKVAELALGYQGGVRAFQSMAGTYGVVVPDEQAQGIVDAWRGRHPLIVEFWGDLRRAVYACVEAGEVSQRNGFVAGRVTFFMQRGHLWCALPNSRLLCYPFPRIAEVPRPQSMIDADIAAGVDPVRTHSRAVVYQTRETRAGRKNAWTEVQLYGALLAENATQAVARDVLVAGLRGAERAGWTVVGHVHDEAIVERAPGATAEGLKRAMLTLPSWAEGLPVDAAADGPLRRYRK